MDSLEGEVGDNVAHLKAGVLKSSFTMICFENLSTLKELDLSFTKIQSLPPFISMLSQLVNLTLKECSMLMVIPPEIGILKNLMKFDLEGTEIMYLPKEMGKLENLTCLRVSFYAFADEYKNCNGIENIIPRKIMSKFRKLEELSICVDPIAKWWEVEVIEAILVNLHLLPCLQTLKVHFPTAKELQHLSLKNHFLPIYSTLRDFRLTVGHSKQLTSYLKTKLVDSFEKLEKCVKYENGEEITNDIKELVKHAKALFVCRHWTIEMLSIFNLRMLKYCLLAECNNMRNIVDADYPTKNAFEYLEYLAIHSMKNLQSIWKGPLAGMSFFRLQVLALHTCPNLITIFTEHMLDNLHNLAVLIVEDCPKVQSLISQGSTHGSYDHILFPNLRKILLLDLPVLVSLSNGLYIAPQLDTLLVFNCLKLDYLSQNELSSNVKEIKGETEWWDALKNRNEWSRAFVPLKRDGDLMNQLADDTNSLRAFHKLQGSLKEFHKVQGHGGPSEISSSTFVLPDSRPLPDQSSLYETKKHRDWDMFMWFLKYRKLPVPFSRIKSGHVIEFLKYLYKFGDIRVHAQNCVLFGHPNPAATCFCPLREAWSTLEAIAIRLHAAYEENRFPYMEPFASRDIQSYLYEIRKSQENALKIPSKMQDFSIMTEDYGAGTMNDEATGTVINESSKFKELLQASSVTSALTHFTDFGINPFTTEFAERSISLAEYSGDNITESSKSLLKDLFCAILRVNIKIEGYALSFAVAGSSSIHELQVDDYVKRNTMILERTGHLRRIAVWASSNGCIQPFVEIYIRERKIVIQTRILQFNIEEWSAYDVKRFEWGVLESLIESWIKSVKTSFEYFFASEKQLCEEIFRGIVPDIEDICYEVIVQDYRTQVFNMIYILSFSNPPPDKIFLILDLYQTLDLFLNKTGFIAKPIDPSEATVHNQLLAVLADKISSNLSIFEKVLLYHESSVIYVGPVDPLPRYVMHYLCQLCEHKSTLRKLSLPKLPSIDEDDLILYSEELEGQSELSRHAIWIIMVIMSNIEGKAKLCENGSAGHFFAMKNIGYIVHEIAVHQGLKEVIGYDYYDKLIQKLDHAKFNYLRLELEEIIKMRDYGGE